MLEELPPKTYRHRRHRKAAKVAPPPVSGPVLVSASYDELGPVVILTFDRAIDITALDPSAFALDDGVIAGTRYVGTDGSMLIDPQTAQVALMPVEASAAPDTRLTVSADSGIIAADASGTWAGVVNLLLPFP